MILSLHGVGDERDLRHGECAAPRQRATERSRLVEQPSRLAGHAAILLALALGCAPSRPRPVGPSVGVPPGRWDLAADLTPVWVPTWLDLAPELRAQALAEVESAGVPSGYSVVVMDPGSFSAPTSPTGLARGVADLGARTLYVAWRFPASGRVLPALEHEVEHARVWEATHDAALAACVGHEEVR